MFQFCVIYHLSWRFRTCCVPTLRLVLTHLTFCASFPPWTFFIPQQRLEKENWRSSKLFRVHVQDCKTSPNTRCPRIRPSLPKFSLNERLSERHGCFQERPFVVIRNQTPKYVVIGVFQRVRAAAHLAKQPLEAERPSSGSRGLRTTGCAVVHGGHFAVTAGLDGQTSADRRRSTTASHPATNPRRQPSS